MDLIPAKLITLICIPILAMADLGNASLRGQIVGNLNYPNAGGCASSNKHATILPVDRLRIYR